MQTVTTWRRTSTLALAFLVLITSLAVYSLHPLLTLPYLAVMGWMILPALFARGGAEHSAKERDLGPDRDARSGRGRERPGTLSGDAGGTGEMSDHPSDPRVSRDDTGDEDADESQASGSTSSKSGRSTATGTATRKPRRTRARAKKVNAPASEPIRTANSRWHEVAPGKFLRVELPADDAAPNAQLTFDHAEATDASSGSGSDLETTSIEYQGVWASPGAPWGGEVHDAQLSSGTHSVEPGPGGAGQPGQESAPADTDYPDTRDRGEPESPDFEGRTDAADPDVSPASDASEPDASEPDDASWKALADSGSPTDLDQQRDGEATPGDHPDAVTSPPASAGSDSGASASDEYASDDVVPQAADSGPTQEDEVSDPLASDPSLESSEPGSDGARGDEPSADSLGEPSAPSGSEASPEPDRDGSAELPDHPEDGAIPPDEPTSVPMVDNPATGSTSSIDQPVDVDLVSAPEEAPVEVAPEATDPDRDDVTSEERPRTPESMETASECEAAEPAETRVTSEPDASSGVEPPPDQPDGDPAPSAHGQASEQPVQAVRPAWDPVGSDPFLMGSTFANTWAPIPSSESAGPGQETAAPDGASWDRSEPGAGVPGDASLSPPREAMPDDPVASRSEAEAVVPDAPEAAESPDRTDAEEQEDRDRTPPPESPEDPSGPPSVTNAGGEPETPGRTDTPLDDPGGPLTVPRMAGWLAHVCRRGTSPSMSSGFGPIRSQRFGLAWRPGRDWTRPIRDHVRRARDRVRDGLVGQVAGGIRGWDGLESAVGRVGRDRFLATARSPPGAISSG